MTGVELIAGTAAVAASIGALARATRVRRVHALGVPLLLAGWIGLIVCIAPASVRDRWWLVVAGLAVALVVAMLAARVLAGRERWVLAAGALVLTLRVPVPTGDGTAMLLGPLYVVIGLGAVLLMRREWRELRGDGANAALADRGGATRLLDVGAAALPTIATMSLMWSFDRDASIGALAFFLVPFVLAYALVRAWASAGTDLRPASWALIGSGLAAALVAVVQAATHTVWWNPKVVDANRFRADFRVNSFYWDPNILGRALVVTLIAVIAWMLVTRFTPRRAVGAVLACVVLVVALWNTFSQSSWVALAGALTVIAVLTLPPRARRWVAAVLVILVLAGLPAAASRLAGDDASGRQDVVRAGVSLAAEKPVLGWGVGSFEAAARARALEQGDRDPGLLASHTTPVTVFAELGVLGMFTYLTLLASAAIAVLARWRQTSSPAAAARARGEDAAATGWPIAPLIWASGTLVALFVHSLLYAGFFEDATLWVALAILASLPLVDDQQEYVEGIAGEPTTPST